MTRSETTKFLSDLLVHDRLTGMGKHYASEVSIDYGTKDVRRIDFLQFQPEGTISVSAIEKGIFIAYEVKSCKEDFYSGFGRNFIAEKNYFVMPMETYKVVNQDIEYSVGAICPVPKGREMIEEFNDPTPLDKDGIVWRTEIIIPARRAERKKSMQELLFCMLRSGK